MLLPDLLLLDVKDSRSVMIIHFDALDKDY